MKKQDFFCQICVIGDISIEGARAPWATPLVSAMMLRKIAPLSSFIKKNI